MIKISDKEFRQLSIFIKEHSGINLKPEKRTLLMGRLNNMLTDLGLKTFTDYYNYLLNDSNGEALSKLIDKVTTNHTFFMRESEHFNIFKGEVLPYLKNKIIDRDLRLWCAASSSGEEPYTIAMILDEYFGNEKLFWNKKILATDLSLSILEQAKKGIYSKEKVSSLPKMWLLNYFDKHNQNDYIIKGNLKREVIYRRFNLLEPTYPFKKKFHVIFCRNVMIYFDSKTKEEIVNKLYDNLEYGGYLFIGHSESLNKDKTNFKFVRPAVYRKI